MRGLGLGRDAGYSRGNPYPFCRRNPELPARRADDISEVEYLKITAAYLEEQLDIVNEQLSRFGSEE